MAIQGFEVVSAPSAFKASGKDRLGRDVKDHEFPEGTLLIPARQPLARLLLAMLEFDPRMISQFLTDERRDLLRLGRTRIYDTTGWSLSMLFDVEAYELAGDPPAEAKPPAPPAPPADPVSNADSTVAFVIDGADDASIAAAGRLMERAAWVRVADRPFQFDGRDFPRGSVLITRKDNTGFTGDLVATLREVCSELKVAATGIRTGLGPGDLPDLGGEHFVLLQPPRIAIVGRESIGPYGYGEAWHQIDHVLGLRASYLDSESLGGTDLRRYNVLVIPSGAADLIKGKMDALKAWASAGGTIIAVGSSAATFAKEKEGLGGTRLLPDVLTKMDEYRQAVVREWEGRQTTPEPEKVWSFAPPAEVVYPWMIGDKEDKPSDDELKRRDAWRGIFMPAGALLAGRVDDKSWLTAGCGEYVPVIYSSDVVFAAPPTVQAPVRLGFFNPAPEAPKEEAKPAETKPSESKPPEPKPPESKPPESRPTEPSPRPARASETDPRSAVGKPRPEPESKPAPKPEPEPAAKAEPQTKGEAKHEKTKDDKKEKPSPGWTIAPPGYEMRLRMSGLLWPEAADRLANAAYVTRESIGSGQLVLFASDPTFRAAALGTTRIFSNAVVCGPGMGASQPIKP
jgi:hypothetical protein